MREFKYTGWLEYDKLDSKHIPPGRMYDKNKGDCLSWKSKGIELINIMQFTGLTARHGNDVYEADTLWLLEHTFKLFESYLGGKDMMLDRYLPEQAYYYEESLLGIH